MRLRINAETIEKCKDIIAGEIECCVNEALLYEQALGAHISVGDVILMYDHEDLIEAMVVRKSSVPMAPIDVIDKQGFMHVCERWMYCECTGNIVLRSLVPAASKKGYSSKDQRKTSNAVWVDIFNQVFSPKIIPRYN